MIYEFIPFADRTNNSNETIENLLNFHDLKLFDSFSNFKTNFKVSKTKILSIFRTKIKFETNLH